jgi:hypothetical protein
MAAPYSSVTVQNYNTNPPSDDGSQVPSNEITWAKSKEKLGDPLKSAIEDVNTNVVTAVGKLAGGIITVSDDYNVLASDQGKTIALDVAAKTITTPDATVVDDPFDFAVVNISTGDITLDGHGSQTIDGLASLVIRPGGGVRLNTDGDDWVTQGRNYERTLIKPQGYLTMTSGTPVISSAVVSGTALYYAIDQGALTPVSDGSNITVQEFSEMTLTLNSNHVASTLYDVFLFVDSGTMRIGTGPAWNTSTPGSGARGTGAGTTELERFHGLWVNKVSMTVRNGASTYSVGAKAGIYLGTIYMDGTNGQLTCDRAWGQAKKWGVWNCYNRKPLYLRSGDSLSSWTYNNSAVRQSRNSSSNFQTVLCGLAEEPFEITFRQRVTTTGDSDDAAIGIGINSTSVMTGFIGRWNGSTNSHQAVIEASHILDPAIGAQTLNTLESTANGSVDYNGGGNGNMVLSTRWMG